MSEIAKSMYTIGENAIRDGKATRGTKEQNEALLEAIRLLSKACATLTSSVKAEREIGKTMVRRWKNGNSF